MYPAPINLGKDFTDGDRKYSRVVINSMMAAARTLLNWSNFLPHNYMYHHLDHFCNYQFKIVYIITFHVLAYSESNLWFVSNQFSCLFYLLSLSKSLSLSISLSVFFIRMVVIITIIRKLRWSLWFPWCSMWSVWWGWRHSVMGRFHHCHKNNPCTSHHPHRCHKNNLCLNYLDHERPHFHLKTLLGH